MKAQPEDEIVTLTANLINACAKTTDVLAFLRTQEVHLKRIEAMVCQMQRQSVDSDGWLDAKGAAEYMGIATGTFDKYRYKTTPCIKGYPLDGKILYKKSDLDQFVKLYSVKSEEGR